MADIVTLAKFELDTTEIENNLSDLRKVLFDIQKEQKRYANQNAELEKQYKELDKVQRELVKRRETESQQYKDVVSKMKEVRTQQEGIFNSQKELQTQQAKVNKEYQSYVEVQKVLMDREGALLSVQEKLNDALGKEINTRAQAKANSIELNKIKDQLNLNNAEEADILEIINKRIDENNELLKQSGSQREKQIANIGRYKQDIKEAYDELNIFNGGMFVYIERIKEAGGVAPFFTSSLSKMSAGFVGLTKSALAFIATPIGAVLTAIVASIALVTNAMNKNEESAGKLNRMMDTLSRMFSYVLKTLEPLGTFLVDGLAMGFDIALMSATKTFDFISKALDSLGFKDASENVNTFNNGLKQSIINAKDLESVTAQLRKTQAEYNRESGRLTELFKEQNKIAEDTTKSISERENAVRESIKASEDLQKLEVSRLELEKERAILEAKNATDRDIAASEYEKRIGEINASAIEAQTTQNNKLNIIRQQALDTEISRQNDLFELWLTQQDQKAKTLQQEYDQEVKASEKRKRILSLELQGNKISREKYNAEILKIENDLAKKRSEIASEVAKRELDDFIKKNQTELREEEILTKELLDKEIERESIINQQRQSEAQLRREQGLINEQEYQDELLLIQEEALTKEGELRNRYLEQQRQQRQLSDSLDLQLRLQQLESNAWTEFDAKQLILDEQTALEQEKLTQQLDANLITQENYDKAMLLLSQQHAKAQMGIDAMREGFKLSLASQTFGNLATILGEQTALGKGMAVSQTLIDTYQSATAAFKAMAGIPIVGPALGTAAAAAAVVSGLANAKKISSTKIDSGGGKGKSNVHVKGLSGYQGFDTGGVIQEGLSRANGDSLLITAKPNEVILNEMQRRMIGDNLLSSIGVPGINPSNSNALQSGLSNVFDYELLTEAVRLGSYQGSALGSQDGIIGLSENRQIQQSASF